MALRRGHLWLSFFITVAGCIGVVTQSTRAVIWQLPDARSSDVARFEQLGKASWYGAWHHGRLTASGQPFDMNALTAAHRSLPLAAKVRVTNLENGRSVDVTINDRGPYIEGRIIDLSARAARELGMLKEGVVEVKIVAIRSSGRNGGSQASGARPID